MDQALRDFQVGAMADAVEAWDHRVIITLTPDTQEPVETLELKGVQADAEIDPEQLQQFGFKVKRVFAFTTNDSESAARVRDGMRGVEQNTGETCRVLHRRKDILGVTLYFGTVNQ